MDGFITAFTTVLSSPVTPITLAFGFIALIFLGFFRGVIFSKFVVEQMLKVKDDRIEDYKTALALEQRRNDKLQVSLDKQLGILEKLLISAELSEKILRALPIPEEETK